MPSISKLIIASGNLPKILLTSPDHARAEIYLHGAHITSWMPAGGNEQLFLSQKSEFRQGAAIRGGVPIIFPQFSNIGPLMRHGFARVAAWEFVSAETVVNNAVAATFRLHDSDATQKNWPYSFLAEFIVTLGGNRLEMRFAVTNTDSQQFSFTAALHTYFRVTDVSQVSIKNLDGVRYHDQVTGKDEVETAASVKFDGEVNRIYFNTPQHLILREGNRTMDMQATGFTDAVVWNPGATNGAALSDLEAEGYRRFVCVEAAAIAAPVQLAPNESWRGTQTLSV
jgi:glucose-6-phosphate 1-epimerase